MLVFIAERVECYAGATMLGIFSSREEAEAVALASAREEVVSEVAWTVAIVEVNSTTAPVVLWKAEWNGCWEPVRALSYGAVNELGHIEEPLVELAAAVA